MASTSAEGSAKDRVRKQLLGQLAREAADPWGVSGDARGSQCTDEARTYLALCEDRSTTRMDGSADWDSGGRRAAGGASADAGGGCAGARQSLVFCIARGPCPKPAAAVDQCARGRRWPDFAKDCKRPLVAFNGCLDEYFDREYRSRLRTRDDSRR